MHEYFKDISNLELLTSRQRAEFVNEVLTRPGLLKKATGGQVCELYFAARLGALDAALEMLGKWCQLHPDGETILGTPHSPYQHGWYREITIGIVWQYAPHHEMLEEQYLEMPDGGCSLPVACVFAHAYKVQDRYDEWIEKLDGRLADKSITGDQRVNWLLARAYAEEMLEAQPKRRFAPNIRPLAGKGWIETACLVAQTEPVRRRAYKELMVRWLAEGQFGSAREVVATAESRLTSPESTEALTAWTAEIDRLVEEERLRQEARKIRVEQDYLRSLEERRRRAESRGNQEAVGRLTEMIENIKGTAADQPSE